MTSQKKKIVIEVDPLMATTTIGLIKGIFSSIIKQLELQGDNKLQFSKVDEMSEVLNEIYEKCIMETNIRQDLKIT